MSYQCPICQNSKTSLHANTRDIEYFTSDAQFSYVRCEDCDILFVSPMLHDRLSEIYPDNYYSFKAGKAGLIQRIKETLDRRFFRSLLSRIVGSDLAVLDVGGGTGWLLDAVKECDSRVKFTQVVDIDAAGMEAARRNGHDYFLGQIEDFQTERKFDLILMLNLIEHVRRPDEVLAKAGQLLSRDGLIAIKTPNFDALDARIFRYRSWGGYHSPRHFVLFTRDSFSRICRKAELEIASFSYTQGAPFWTTSALNELRELGIVNISRERPLIYHPIVPLFQALFAVFDFIRRPFGRLSQMFFVLRRPTS